MSDISLIRNILVCGEDKSRYYKVKSRHYKVSDISLIRNILVCGEDEKQVLQGE